MTVAQFADDMIIYSRARPSVSEFMITSRFRYVPASLETLLAFVQELNRSSYSVTLTTSRFPEMALSALHEQKNKRNLLKCVACVHCISFGIPQFWISSNSKILWSLRNSVSSGKLFEIHISPSLHITYKIVSHVQFADSMVYRIFPARVQAGNNLQDLKNCSFLKSSLAESGSRDIRRPFDRPLP